MPAVPDGVRVYAIGDIHGMARLLKTLLKTIKRDLKGYEGRSEIVFLGDYIDRGPDSAAVIERLCEGPGPGDAWICLKGNHDAFLSDTMYAEKLNSRYYRAWVEQGGLEAMLSWGVDRATVYGDPDEAVAALRKAMPKPHRKFFRKLKSSYQTGDYMFVHAGVRPHIDLDDQQEKDLLWIREDFLKHRKDFGAHIVHGHTIFEDVDAQRNRTGVDTGAYKTGKLSALVLEGKTRRVLST
ncbi:MAG: metallophosphoesterase [Pacificimonas sp.]